MGGGIESTNYGKGKIGVYSENGTIYKAVANNYDKSKMLVFMYDEKTGQEYNRREVTMVDSQINGEKIGDNKVPHVDIDNNEMVTETTADGQKIKTIPNFTKGIATAAQELFFGKDYESISQLPPEEQEKAYAFFSGYEVHNQ